MSLYKSCKIQVMQLGMNYFFVLKQQMNTTADRFIVPVSFEFPYLILERSLRECILCSSSSTVLVTSRSNSNSYKQFNNQQNNYQEYIKYMYMWYMSH